MVKNLNLRAWTEIDLNAVDNNFNVLSSLLPKDMKVLVVLKADAYGHGAKHIGKFLAGRCDYFGVARADEAVELRRCGINNSKILILGHTAPYHYSVLFKHDLIPTVYSLEEAELLQKSAEEYGQELNIHIALDTGMSRIGFDLSDESIEAICRISRFENLSIDGVFSHFADADNGLSRNFTDLQLQRFRSFTEKLSDAGVKIPIRHLFNSAAISELEPEFEMVREGIYIYGLFPSNTVSREKVSGLIPAMSLRAEVIHVHEIEEGTPVSYGCTYVAPSKRTVATVCIGYADGVPRKLSNTGSVIINGRFAPIIGKVCMDQLMCDVTGIPNVTVGSVATVFGKDGNCEICASDVASIADTISYEILCGISKRVPRVYYKNGEIYTIHYGIPHEEF